MNNPKARGRGGRRRGGRGRPNANSKQQPSGSVSYTRLKEWAELGHDPGELFVRILHNLDYFAAFLNSDAINSDKMELLGAIFDTVLTCKNLTHGFKQILAATASSRLYSFHLTRYTRGRLGGGDPSVDAVVDVMMRLVVETCRCLAPKIEGCRSFIEHIVDSDLEQSLGTVAVSMVDSFIEAIAKNVTAEGGKIARCVDQEDDFRQMTVFPSERDVTDCARPVFRANKVVGAFRDKGEYFDVMFRLLREDFMRPLRETVGQCRQGKKHLSDSTQIVYEDVRIIGARAEEGVEHVLRLDIARLNESKWDCTSCFMTGNLVCVSNDNFKSVLFATVAHNSANNLSLGILFVHFHNCFEAVYGISADEKLKLVESPSFFVAYRYVLEGLQDMFDLHLPMESYLVQCVTESKQTAYLTDTACYDLSCIKGDDLKHVKWSQQQILPNYCWPGLTKVCLNKEQYTAIKVALTRELTLLQGPPGTGKTYVSWKLMRILLENRGRGVPDDKPILVVCFTNHALDQFLEGLLQFCDQGIVRVGGRSDSTALKPFNLGEIRHKRKKSTFASKYTNCVLKKINAAEREIRQVSREIKMFKVDLPELEDLTNFMSVTHFQSLPGATFTDAPDKPKLKLWLDIEEVDLETSITTAVQIHLVSLIKKCSLVRKESGLDFSRNIPVTTKAAVYKYWVSAYERKFGKSSKDQLLGDEALSTVVSDKVLAKIHGGGYETVTAWLLGRDVDEMLDAIDELQKNMFQRRDAAPHDETDDDDESNFQEDADCEEEELKEEFDSRKVEILNRALMLGVDVTMCDTSSSENAWMKMTYGQALRKIKDSLPMSQEEALVTSDVWTLDRNSRYRLYKAWYNDLMVALSSRLQALTDHYNLLLEQYREIRAVQDIAILKEAMVVGMTTTGAARNRKLLRTIGPRIIVVEEAAEVLEAHIITALNEHCQHLILIGDHQQLRPRTQVYQLAQDFGLEVSMFERLVNNKFTCIQLVEQHRMRPEISVFMRLIYPDLKDSESVKGRPSVSGMDNNVFFIKHNQPENNVKNSASKLNNFEARYLVKLCEYLLMQGHLPEEITILGAYSGQVTLIQELINNSKKPLLQSVQVSTVDNFQGEQNKIILLSLVRSNAKENVGFLSTDNRVCVALSRAQYGMYVIGDIDLLVRHSDLWYNIDQTAERQGCIGNLRLRCRQHGRITEIADVKDWTKAIQLKGCGQACNNKLSRSFLASTQFHIDVHDSSLCHAACFKTCPRGHKCTGKCRKQCPECPSYETRKLPCGHILQGLSGLGHFNVVCRQLCLKKCPAGHPCPLQCKDRCSPCSVSVKRVLNCGHEYEAACHKPTAKCDQRCQKVCRMGHQCQATCSETCPPCKEQVHKRLPCGHLSFVECGYRRTCRLPCEKICVKGHPCPKRCVEPCPPCGIVLPCGHICSDLPSGAMLRDELCYKLCRKVCTNGHVCPKRCLERCSKNCTVVLRCGHTCEHPLVLPPKAKCPPLQIRASLPLPCGHGSQKICCNVASKDTICTQISIEFCERGHERIAICSQSRLPCTELLACGHVCRSITSTQQTFNARKFCLEPCKKVCSRGHACPNKCFQPCPSRCPKVVCKVVNLFARKGGFKIGTDWSKKSKKRS